MILGRGAGCQETQVAGARYRAEMGNASVTADSLVYSFASAAQSPLSDLTNWTGGWGENWPRLRQALQTTVAACLAYAAADS